MSSVLCVREDCQHSATDHSRLAGCTVQEGSTFCSCSDLLIADGPGPAVPADPPPDGVDAEPVDFPEPSGDTYVQEIDGARLSRQQSAVYTLMRDGRFRTLRQVADVTGFPEASVSARLRDLRRAPLNRDVQRRRRGETGSVWEYAVLDPETA